MPQPDPRQVYTETPRRKVFRPPREPTLCYAKIARWNPEKKCGVIILDSVTVIVLLSKLFERQKVTETDLTGRWLQFSESNVVAGKQANNKTKVLQFGRLVNDPQTIAQLEFESTLP